MSAASRRRAVDRLDAADLKRLNEAFYLRDPHVYFQRRLALLLVSEAVPSGLGSLLDEHNGYKGLGQTLNSLQPTLDPEALAAAKAGRFFATVEGVVLFHHVAEALIRLVFAHEGRPNCPWARMVENRSVGDFARQVRTEICDPSLEVVVTKLTPVLLLHEPGEPDPQVPEVAVRNTVAIIRRIATLFLEETELYNSCKHGMSTAIGGTIMSVHLPLGVVVEASGGTLQYLRWAAETADGKGSLESVITWPDVEEHLALTYIATRLMQSIWSLARARYVDSGEANLYLFEAPEWRDLVSRRPGSLIQVSERFSYPGSEHLMKFAIQVDGRPNKPPEA